MQGISMNYFFLSCNFTVFIDFRPAVPHKGVCVSPCYSASAPPSPPLPPLPPQSLLCVSTAAPHVSSSVLSF